MAADFHSGKQAIIVGGSVGGLMTALLLRRAGWRTAVYERVEVELSARGAGIVTHPELFAAIQRAGIAEEAVEGVAIALRTWLDRSGKVVAERPFPQISTGWDRLYQALRGAYRGEAYHHGKLFCDARQQGDRVVAEFADGSEVACDLLIGADGFRSAVRGKVVPGQEPVYVGYVAWRGLIDEAAFSADTHRSLFEYFAFCIPAGEQMLGYPVAGPDEDRRAGHRRYNTVWYRPADAAQLRELLTDASGRVHEVSIPPPLIRPELTARLRADAERLLAPQFAEAVRLTPQPFFQPIYDFEAERMAAGRMALVGDAAFVVRPHVGAGVTKAFGDAIALTDALARNRDVPAALAEFSRERVAIGRRMVARARELGACIHAHNRPPQDPALAARAMRPEVMLADTASITWLREAAVTTHD